MQLPSALRHVINDGKAVLILGAGASMEARDSHGNRPPSGVQLAQRLADYFLGGTFRDSPLNQVAEYAISESDLVTVQTFIADIFSVFAPSKAHMAIAAQSWPGLATTNYDTLLESAYGGASSPSQALVPFIDNSDRVLTPHHHDRVHYLKLHGCITRARITDPPLILTTDQYADFERGRSHVFQELLT
jgi:hypothetical protein